MLREDILRCIQLYGRQSARQIADRLERPEKSVMRELINLCDLNLITYDEIKVTKYLKMRRWGVKAERTRFYYITQ